jgi:hypothetical protein
VPTIVTCLETAVSTDVTVASYSKGGGSLLGRGSFTSPNSATALGHHRESTWTLPGHYRDNTWTLPGHYRDSTWTLPGQYLDITGTLQGQYLDITKTVPGQYRDMAANDQFISRHLQVNIHYPPYHSIRGGQTDQFQNPHFSSQHGPCINKTRHFFSFFMSSYICSSISTLQSPSLMGTKPLPPSQETCATRVVATPCLHPELPAASLNKSQTGVRKYSHTHYSVLMQSVILKEPSAIHKYARLKTRVN